MSEILTHEQHVALVEDLVCCAEQDIRDDMDDSSIATQTRKALVLAQFAALRSALAAAERDAAYNADEVTRQNHLWSERCEAAESERDRLRDALGEIAAGDHGEYCGLRNQMLLAGGKTECYADCPKRVAQEALAPAPRPATPHLGTGAARSAR